MKRWLNWIALVVAFSVACGFLSNWQFTRRAQKLAAIELVNRNYEASPISIDSLSDSSVDMPRQTWQSLEVTGSYIPGSLTLVRNRSNDGNPGFEEVVAFRCSSGALAFVSRGWLPTGERQDSPDFIELPSGIETRIIGKVVPYERDPKKSAPKGQVQAISRNLLDRATGLTTTLRSFYLRMVSESPSVGAKLEKLPPPSTDEGNNLSYAIQWILFALMAALALIWRIRRDRKLAQGIPLRKRRTRASIDEEFEDSTTAR